MRNREAADAATAAGLAQIRQENECIICGREAWRENHAGRVAEVEIQVEAAAPALIRDLIAATKRGLTGAKPGKLVCKPDSRPEVVEILFPERLVRIRRVRSNEFKCRQPAVFS